MLVRTADQERKAPSVSELRIGDSLSIHRGPRSDSEFDGVATVVRLPGPTLGAPRRSAYIALRKHMYRIRYDGVLQRVPNHEPTVMFVKARYGD